MASVRKLRRQNRRKTVYIVLLLFVILILSGFLVFTALKQYKVSKEPIHDYVSMTEEASARAFVWLSNIEDTELTYEEVKECMGDFNLEIVKTPADKKGVYTMSLADNAYGYCLSQAKTGLERAYRLSVCKRITSTGYEGTVNDELVESLMQETFGMSVSDYISQCEIVLLPSEEELISKYSGEVSDEENK